jgi:hypothetical protein
MAAGDELELAIAVDPKVLTGVWLEVVTSVACGVAYGVDCEALERAALIPEGGQGLGAVVLMTAT